MAEQGISLSPTCHGLLFPPEISEHQLGNARRLTSLVADFIPDYESAYTQFQSLSQESRKSLALRNFSIVRTRSNVEDQSNHTHDIVYRDILKWKMCLADTKIKFYDCNDPMTLWSAQGHCPAACYRRPSPTNMCSRILACIPHSHHVNIRGASYSINWMDPSLTDFRSFNVDVTLGTFAAFHLESLKGSIDSAGLKSGFLVSFFINEDQSENIN